MAESIPSGGCRTGGSLSVSIPRRHRVVYRINMRRFMDMFPCQTHRTEIACKPQEDGRDFRHRAQIVSESIEARLSAACIGLSTLLQTRHRLPGQNGRGDRIRTCDLLVPNQRARNLNPLYIRARLTRSVAHTHNCTHSNGCGVGLIMGNG